jgi:hypothetical protein
MRCPRTPSKLSDLVHQRLNSYALAASAAGVGALALAQPVAAKIVYTPAHVRISPNHTIALDLNHDGVRDFSFKDTYEHWNGNSGGGVLQVAAANQANAIVETQRGVWASALSAGVRIGPRLHFGGPSPGMAVEFPSYSGTGLYTSGPWRQAKHRYLGLEFVIHGKNHFGWARLDVTCKASGVFGTLTGYAYETIPNKPIVAGKIQEGASLGALAAGSTEIHSRRQE